MNESESFEGENVEILDSREHEELLRYVNRFELINKNKNIEIC